MAKMKLDWHKECLDNAAAFVVTLSKTIVDAAASTMYRAVHSHSDNKFKCFQILEATRRRLLEYDGDRLAINKKDGCVLSHEEINLIVANFSKKLEALVSETLASIKKE